MLALAAGLAAVLLVTVFGLLIADFSDVEYWKKLGYPGVLLFSFIGAVGMIFPVPGLVVVCGAGGLELNPIVVGLLGGAGEAAGEISGYAIGYGGRSVFERRSLFHRIRRLMRTHGTLVVFLVSVIPNPLFDAVGIVAGGTNFPLRRFFVTVWVGRR